MRVLVVTRPLSDVRRSLQRLMPGAPDPQPALEALLGRLCRALSIPGVTLARFDQLDDPQVVTAALKWLMPGADVDPEKVAAMRHLNVQTDIERTLRLAKERAADLDSFLGADVASELRERM